MRAWWHETWVNQLWRLHLHHVEDKQRLRRRLRDVEEALEWAHVVAAEQTRLRLEAQAREVLAVQAAADTGLELLTGWLEHEGEQQHEGS